MVPMHVSYESDVLYAFMMPVIGSYMLLQSSMCVALMRFLCLVVLLHVSYESYLLFALMILVAVVLKLVQCSVCGSSRGCRSFCSVCFV